MSYTTSVWLTTMELYGKEDNTYYCIIVINSLFVLALQVIYYSKTNTL